MSTHFASPLRANLAFDAAVTSSQSIVWIPATTDVAAEADDDSSDDGDERNAWDDSEKQPTRGGAGRGIAVCQIIRNGLRFMTPVARAGEQLAVIRLLLYGRWTDPGTRNPGAVDPVIPLTFLTDLYHVLEFYIDGPVTEATVKVGLQGRCTLRGRSADPVLGRTTLISSLPCCTRCSPEAAHS